MIDPEVVARWVVRGAGSVRDDARRVLRELVDRGDLSAEEAEAIEAGVGEAIGRTLRAVESGVVEPLGRGIERLREHVSGLAAPAVHDDLAARLDAIEARLARIEELAERGAPRRDAPPDTGREEPQ